MSNNDTNEKQAAFSDEDETVIFLRKIFLTIKWGFMLGLSVILVAILRLIEKATNSSFTRFLHYDDEMRFDNELGLVRKFKDGVETRNK